ANRPPPGRLPPRKRRPPPRRFLPAPHPPAPPPGLLPARKRKEPAKPRAGAELVSLDLASPAPAGMPSSSSEAPGHLTFSHPWHLRAPSRPTPAVPPPPGGEAAPVPIRHLTNPRHFRRPPLANPSSSPAIATATLSPHALPPALSL